MSADAVNQLFASLDVDKGGSIEYRELHKLLRDKAAIEKSKERRASLAEQAGSSSAATSQQLVN